MSDRPAPIAFVLDGQGIPASTSPQTIAAAQQDAHRPLAHAVLLACHAAFLSDLASLSPEERAAAGLAADVDAPTPAALLELPTRHAHNALVANVHLYLVQLLRFAASVDPQQLGSLSVAPQLGVLGFSTGMIAATVIACADSIPRFVAHATEAFRLAFWLGLRAQQYAAAARPHVALPDPAGQSWTLVTFGATRDEVQAAVDKFNAENVSICACQARDLRC